MTAVYYRTFATRDAAIALACVSPGLQRALMRAVGLTDEVQEKPLGDHAAETRHYAALQTRMETLMASRTTAEWKTIFDAHGIPAAGVKIPLELLDDPQALANGMLHDLEHPALGPVRVVSTPVRLDGDGFEPAAPARPFGSETREILRALKFSDADVDGFLGDGVTHDRCE
jgi:crotonobetainyl-CoA:carnitine CoA-transferase CaiB-like acyl-CoA transferase